MAMRPQSREGERDGRSGWARRDVAAPWHRWGVPPERQWGGRVIGYVITIVVDLILLGLVRDLPSWRLPFLTAAVVDVLPVLERSLIATIVANGVFCAYDPRWFRDLCQIVLTALALAVAVAIYRVFPFDFGDPAGNDLARLALGGTALALLLALIVQASTWLFNVVRPLPNAGRGDRREPDASRHHER